MKFDTAVKVVKVGSAAASTLGAAVVSVYAKKKLREEVLDQLDVGDWGEFILGTGTDVFVTGCCTIADMAVMETNFKVIDAYANLFRTIANSAKAV